MVHIYKVTRCNMQDFCMLPARFQVVYNPVRCKAQSVNHDLPVLPPILELCQS